MHRNLIRTTRTSTDDTRRAAPAMKILYLVGSSLAYDRSLSNSRQVYFSRGPNRSSFILQKHLLRPMALAKRPSHSHPFQTFKSSSSSQTSPCNLPHRSPPTQTTNSTSKVCSTTKSPPAPSTTTTPTTSPVPASHSNKSSRTS